MLPAPFVVIPLSLSSGESIPNTFKIFAAGTAIPESVTKLVGTTGGTGPDVVLIMPA